MLFEDRISRSPGRYTMTDENGNSTTVVMERADEPTVEGTPLNADTFNKMQEEIQIESDEYPGCFYRLVGGEVEWINPPMYAPPGTSIRYRTAERYLAEPVYVNISNQAVTESNFLSDGWGYVTVYCQYVKDMVDFSAVLKAEDGSIHRIPSFRGDGTLAATIVCRALPDVGYLIEVRLRDEWIGYTVYITAKYTR